MDPVTGLIIGSALIKGISSFLGYNAKKKAAKANRQAALENLGFTQNTLGQREAQEKEAAIVAKQDIGLDADSLRGQTVTSAAAGNVMGSTVDLLLQDVAAQEGRAKSGVERQLDFTLSGIESRRKGAVIEAKQRIASVPNPSAGALALDLAGVGLSAYSSYRSARV